MNYVRTEDDGRPLPFPVQVFDPATAKELKFKGGVNTPKEVLLSQIAQNIRRGLPQVMDFEDNDTTAILVAGGPSINDPAVRLELMQAIAEGGKVVTVNGSYQWCIDNGIRPSAVVMLDAREFNARFVETDVPGCTYFLAAQCHPRVFDICKDRRTYIWHGVSAGEDEIELLKAYYWERFFPIDVGTTVGIRAFSVLRLMGFKKFHVFGLDSCWMGDAHHAYEQAENNGENLIQVWLRPQGRDDKVESFLCSVWQAKQAEDFLQLVKLRGSLFEMQIHGEGLIARMVRTAAELQIEESSKV